MKVYTVQPLSVISKLESGNYLPLLNRSFAREHEFFMRAYRDIKDLYFLLTGVLMLEGETGIWAYPDIDCINLEKLNKFERVCVLEVEDRFLMQTNFQVWESILDGESSVCDSFEKLLNDKEGLQQYYFTAGAIKKVEVLKS